MPKFEDLTGQKFGMLTVIKRVDDYLYPNGKRSGQYLCKCDCGNETIVVLNNLKSGRTKSCGCLLKNINRSMFMDDLTGQRFGRLTVIKRADDYVLPNGTRMVQWLCKCDCGKEKVVIAGNLKSGATKSCGCLLENIHRNVIDDLVGQKFGKLTAIKRVEDYISPKGQHKAQWLCKCDCGNEKVVAGDRLKSGRVKSCGCLNNVMFEDLTGKRFGKLTVIKRAGNYIRPNGKKVPRWLCRCDCGKETEVLARNLKSGCTKSCGCLRGRRKA